MTVQAQKRFYNLTAEELRIDSFLPNVAYSVPLPYDYLDSTYTLSIRYPEYIDMPASDVRKYKAICKDINTEKNPKIQHSISIDKKRATFVAHISPIVFRNGKYQYLVSFLADLKSSPVSKAKAKRLAGKKLAVVPILRAGLGMVDGMVAMIPSAKVGHIGLYRDPETLEPVEYYCKLPADISERDVIVVDPMFATGGSASAACTFLKQHGAKHIKLMCILGAPPAWEKMQKDPKLNDHGYIVPGLGDAGDRIFGTK